MDNKWIREARKHQVMHALVYNEDSTVRTIAAAAHLSVAYTHQLLADMVGEGGVFRVVTPTARQSSVVLYRSKFQHMVALYKEGVIVENDEEGYEMQYAYAHRNCDSAQWYGWKPLDISLPTQTELPF